MINTITIAGRVTRDIQLTQGEKPIANFSVAVNRMKEGECDYINCVAFGKTAEVLNQYVKQGDQVIVNGSLRIENYEDKEGNKRTSAKVVVNTFDFGAKKSGSATSTDSKSLDSAYDSLESDYSDDLPF